MKHIHEVIDTIKHLNPNAISYDSKGRLLIRMNSPSASSQPSEPLTIIHHKNIIYNGLLHPEDRLPRRNINIWLDELLRAASIMQYDQEVDFDHVANTFNRTGLVFTLTGKVHLAERICRKQINYFIQQAKYDFTALKYIIQPWINLGRIDRLRGDQAGALKKFSLLKALQENRISEQFAPFHIPPNHLFDAISLDSTLQEIIKSCAVIEPIKTYLHAQSYYELNDIVSALIDDPASYIYHGVAYEAAILTHVHLNQVRRASNLCEEALERVRPHLMHIFLLRQAELQFMNGTGNAQAIFNRLLKLLDYLEKDNIDINKTLFAVKLSQQLVKCNYPALARQAFIHALYFSQQLADEYLMIESLQGLITLGDNSHFKAWCLALRAETGYALLQQEGVLQDNKIKVMRETKCKKLFNMLMML